MILKKITIENFRQFYGRCEIEFSDSLERNVTLIHAENGVGKTTLLNAIRWCLFEQLSSDFKQPEKLVSEEAIAEGKSSCFVEVAFEHDNRLYYVRRIFDQNRNANTPRYGVEDPTKGITPLSETQGNMLINSIVPKEISEYFFFHGEGITTINDKSNGPKFRKAIRDIMGFRLVEHAIKDLNQIRSNLLKEINSLNSISAEQRDLIKKQAELEGQAAQYATAYSEFEAARDSLWVKRESLQEKIANSGIHNAEQLQKRISSNESRASRLSSQAIMLRKDRAKQIQESGWAALLSKAADIGLDFIDEASLRGKIPAPYDQTFVNDLIDSGVCVCGTSLTPHTEPYHKVLSLLEKANTGLMKTRLMKARSFGDVIREKRNSFLKNIKRIEESLSAVESEVSALTAENEQLTLQLDEIKVDDIARIRELVREVSAQYQQAANKVAECQRDLKFSKDELERVKARRKQNPELTGRAAALNDRADLVERVVKWSEEVIDRREHDSKLTIAAKINAILDRFSRKDYKVKISDDFSFRLIKDGGIIVGESKGENLLLNLLFVSALIDFVRSQELKKGNARYLSIGSVAPFVIDAPFGELDRAYRSIIAKFIPEHTRQVILLLSSSHWEGAVDDAIREKVGREYVLISHKKGRQGSRPDDRIVVRGNPYICSCYESPREMTVIQEVR